MAAHANGMIESDIFADLQKKIDDDTAIKEVRNDAQDSNQLD